MDSEGAEVKRESLGTFPVQEQSERSHSGPDPDGDLQFQLLSLDLKQFLSGAMRRCCRPVRPEFCSWRVTVFLFGLTGLLQNQLGISAEVPTDRGRSDPAPGGGIIRNSMMRIRDVSRTLKRSRKSSSIIFNGSGKHSIRNND